MGAPQQDTNALCGGDERLLAIKKGIVNCGRELRWNLTQETVELLAKEAYRDEAERQKDAVAIGKGSASGTIDPRLTAIKSYLLGSFVDEEQTAEVILRLVQHYGLLHQPMPEPCKTTRDILEEAKAMAARAAKATFHALVKKTMPEELERSVNASRQVAQTKYQSQIYQTMRGDRVIPIVRDEDGNRQMGRRAAPEMTAFLQVASRYLETHQELGANSCMHCLAGVRCIAEGEWPPSSSSVRKMKERNRVRLKDASRLNQSDYREALSVALGVDSETNLLRCSAHSLSIAVLNTPGVSAEDQERAETELAEFEIT